MLAGRESVTTGEALRDAKRSYAINEYNGAAHSSWTDEELTQHTGEDQKILAGMNLYGLPMYTIRSSEADPPPNLALGIKAPGKSNSAPDDRTQILWTHPKTVGTDLLRSERTERIEEAFLTEHVTPDGRFFSYNGITQTNVNEPVQPRVNYLTGTESFFPKGAVLEYARYRTIEDFDPVIEGQPVGRGAG